MNAKIILLGCLLLFGNKLFAQQKFAEGEIVYSVTIGPVGGSSGFTEHAGNYVITIKGSNIRKELTMNSGYKNILLQNNNASTIYSLQSASGQDFAIQLKLQDIKERQRPYESFGLKEEEGSMVIAGQACQKAIATYKDGSTSTLYISNTWQNAEPTLFDRLPGIKNIPLSFEYRNEEGITMHFAAEKIEAKPVENSLFRVPNNYKIITNAEFKALQR